MSGRRAGRSPLAWHGKSAEVYLVNTIAAVGLILWSCLTMPVGAHGVEEILWGGSTIVFLSWVIAFLVAGLPVQRLHPETAQR
jgi:hypothetical protein